MGIFLDPRAFGVTPADEDGSQEMRLLDSDLRILATAIRYSDAQGEWWGVCSHRSAIPIDRRVSSLYEARKTLMATVWRSKGGVEVDEFEHFDDLSRRGALYIRSLTDEQVLEAARSSKSATWKQIFEWMGPQTDRRWITSQCAKVARARNIMSTKEKLWIFR
jgi:hypothetical protein